MVFSGGRAVALIDFDLAAPGSAVWDVACAVRFWAPLRAERDVPEPLRGRSLARLRIFADAYGLPAEQRVRLPAAVRAAHTWAYDVVRDAVADGHDAFSRFWQDGGEGRAERTAAWLERTNGSCAKRSFDRSGVRAGIPLTNERLCAHMSGGSTLWLKHAQAGAAP